MALDSESPEAGGWLEGREAQALQQELLAELRAEAALLRQELREASGCSSWSELKGLAARLEQEQKAHAEMLEGLPGFEASLMRHMEAELKEVREVPAQLGLLRDAQTTLTAELAEQSTVAEGLRAQCEELRTELARVLSRQEVNGPEVEGLQRLEAELADLRQAPPPLSAELAECRAGLEGASKLLAELRGRDIWTVLGRLEAEIVELQAAPRGVQGLEEGLGQLRDCCSGLQAGLAECSREVVHLRERQQQQAALLEGVEGAAGSQIERLRAEHEDSQRFAQNLREQVAELQDASERRQQQAGVLRQLQVERVPPAAVAEEALEELREAVRRLREGQGELARELRAWPSGGERFPASGPPEGLDVAAGRLEEALEAEASRRCMLVAELHERLAREIAQVTRHVELRWQELAARVEAPGHACAGGLAP